VSAALDLFGEGSASAEPNPRRGESVGPLAVAATKAVTQPGTEVAPAEVGGQARGAHGRWAVLLHRIRPAVPLPALPALPGRPAAPPAPPASAATAVDAGTSATAYALGDLDPGASDGTDRTDSADHTGGADERPGGGRTEDPVLH